MNEVLNQEQPTTETYPDDLDEFSKLLFNKDYKPAVVTKDVQPEDDTLAEEDETEDEEAEVEEPDEAPEPPAEKKKTRFQERIDELTTKAKEAERREQSARIEFEAKFKALEAKLNDTKETVQDVPQPMVGEPDSDSKTAEGSSKYPLGEFDPAFIRDLTRYHIKREANELKATQEVEREQKELQDSRNALEVEWSGRLEKAKETYQDLPEKVLDLQSALSGLEPKYGEYLAVTIMSMEYGPDVLYYLASNPTEAQKIASSGAARATIALGRLEARFAFQNEEKGEKKLKVSNAPKPPEHLNKGTKTAKAVADDTDDLDAFAAKFFSIKKRG